MLRTIAIAGFALSVAVSAQAMTPAPIVPQPDSMITEVAAAVKTWRAEADALRIRRSEQDQMSPAFDA